MNKKKLIIIQIGCRGSGGRVLNPSSRTRINIVTLVFFVVVLLFGSFCRLAEDRSPEAAWKAPLRRTGGHRQQAWRVGSSLGQSREGVSVCSSHDRWFVFIFHLFDLIYFLWSTPSIEEDDLIQREVHNADLSNHDRGCILQWTTDAIKMTANQEDNRLGWQ